MKEANDAYLNEFTGEYWRGHEDRRRAADYVTRLPLESVTAPPRYAGRANGQVTEDQRVLRRLRDSILNEVYSEAKR